MICCASSNQWGSNLVECDRRGKHDVEGNDKLEARKEEVDGKECTLKTE